MEKKDIEDKYNEAIDNSKIIYIDHKREAIKYFVIDFNLFKNRTKWEVITYILNKYGKRIKYNKQFDRFEYRRKEQYISFSERNFNKPEQRRKLSTTEMIEKFKKEKEIKLLKDEEKNKIDNSISSRKDDNDDLEMIFGKTRGHLPSKRNYIDENYEPLYHDLKLMNKDGSKIYHFVKKDLQFGVNKRTNIGKLEMRTQYKKYTHDTLTNRILISNILGNTIKNNINKDILIPIDNKVIRKYIKENIKDSIYFEEKEIDDEYKLKRKKVIIKKEKKVKNEMPIF